MSLDGNPLLRVTDAGLFCEQGAFYIDPWLPVDRAVITHAHADHLRSDAARISSPRMRRWSLELVSMKRPLLRRFRTARVVRSMAFAFRFIRPDMFSVPRR